ncbi:MAG TPA: glycosyltransferase family 39 protein [Solirubrobacteraceae bacterium]
MVTAQTSRPRVRRPWTAGAARPWPELVAIAAILVLAAALRLWSLAKVPTDPYYDAAVRSMPLSLRNFLLAAYEPGGSLAVDKPPLDLWLQVLSTQLFGFGSVTLKLPPALAGTAAVAVLYDAVRRVFGTAAGLASALALAVLPIAVLSARSDTMDSVAMLLSVVALWLLVRFAQTGQARWCYLAAVAMGISFNAKLFEGLVVLPALILFGWLVCRERRALRLAISAGVFVLVALSWLLVTLAFSPRPYAIGSTDGSAWNASFVFNGWDRITGASTQPALNAALAPSRLRPANNSEVARSAVPIGPPSLLRLFAHNGPLSGLRLGFVLLVALTFGLIALIWSVIRPRGPDPTLERAFASSLLLWLAIGTVLYTEMARLHPRYTEGFTPAVAAAAGVGVAWVLRDGAWQRVVAVAGALALALYGHYLLGGSSGAWIVMAIGAIAVAAAAAIYRERVRLPLLIVGLALLTLALPLEVDGSEIRNHETDSGLTGAMNTREVNAISSYIAAHRHGARYEFAAADPIAVGALIVKDLQPMLSLTSYNAHELIPTRRLAQLVASGALRFAILDGGCGPHTSRLSPACSAGAAWVRAHGVDVSRRAGLPHSHVLYQLGSR